MFIPPWLLSYWILHTYILIAFKKFNRYLCMENHKVHPSFPLAHMYVTHFNKLHLYLCHMHKQPGTHATRMLRYGAKSLAFRRQNNQFKLETNSTEQWKLSLSEVVSPIYVNCFFLRRGDERVCANKCYVEPRYFGRWGSGGEWTTIVPKSFRMGGEKWMVAYVYLVCLYFLGCHGI